MPKAVNGKPGPTMTNGNKTNNTISTELTSRYMNKLRTKCIHISEDGEQNRRAYFQTLQQQITAQNRRTEAVL